MKKFLILLALLFGFSSITLAKDGEKNPEKKSEEKVEKKKKTISRRVIRIKRPGLEEEIIIEGEPGPDLLKKLKKLGIRITPFRKDGKKGIPFDAYKPYPPMPPHSSQWQWYQKGEDFPKLKINLDKNLFFRQICPKCRLQEENPFPFGIALAPLSKELKDYLGLKNGVMIKEVLKDSRAQKGKVKKMDILLEINGKRISSHGDIQKNLKEIGPGTFQIKVLRKGKEMILPIPGATQKNIQAHLAGELKKLNLRLKQQEEILQKIENQNKGLQKDLEKIRHLYESLLKEQGKKK